MVWRPYERESPSTVRGGLLFDAIAGSSDGVTQPSQSRASRIGVHAFVDSIDIGQFRTGGIEVGAHDVSRINLAVGWYGDPPFDGILARMSSDRVWRSSTTGRGPSRWLSARQKAARWAKGRTDSFPGVKAAKVWGAETGTHMEPGGAKGVTAQFGGESRNGDAPSLGRVSRVWSREHARTVHPYWVWRGLREW